MQKSESERCILFCFYHNYYMSNDVERYIYILIFPTHKRKKGENNVKKRINTQFLSEKFVEIV